MLESVHRNASKQLYPITELPSTQQAQLMPNLTFRKPSQSWDSINTSSVTVNDFLQYVVAPHKYSRRSHSRSGSRVHPDALTSNGHAQTAPRFQKNALSNRYIKSRSTPTHHKRKPLESTLQFHSKTHTVPSQSTLLSPQLTQHTPLFHLALKSRLSSNPQNQFNQQHRRTANRYAMRFAYPITRSDEMR